MTTTAEMSPTPSVSKLGDKQLGDRQGDQGHHVDRAADQPAGAQRHDRGGARRRGGQGLRGRRQRSEGAGQGDREGDRGHQPEDRGDSGPTPARARSRPSRKISDPDQQDQRHTRNTIASAVEEQTATTNEMSRNVTEAARKAARRSRRISPAWPSRRKSTTEGANDTQQRIGRTFASMAGELQLLQLAVHQAELIGRHDDHRTAVHRAHERPLSSMIRRPCA